MHASISFELLGIKNKQLCCMFVDFDKAIDDVWRKALVLNLLPHDTCILLKNVYYFYYVQSCQIKNCMKITKRLFFQL